MTEKKHDVELSDGRKVYIDLYKLSKTEYFEVVALKPSNEQADKAFAKITGLTSKEVAEMPYPDWKMIRDAFMEKAISPYADPN